MNTDSAKTALIGGIVTVAVALGGAALNGWSQLEQAKQKFNSELVMKALEAPTGEERIKFLRLLTETHLLNDKPVFEGVKSI